MPVALLSFTHFVAREEMRVRITFRRVLRDYTIFASRVCEREKSVMYAHRK